MKKIQFILYLLFQHIFTQGKNFFGLVLMLPISIFVLVVKPRLQRGTKLLIGFIVLLEVVNHIKKISYLNLNFLGLKLKSFLVFLVLKQSKISLHTQVSYVVF